MIHDPYSQKPDPEPHTEVVPDDTTSEPDPPLDLPADIARIWDDGGYGAETARALIAQWGEEVFRRSAIHAAAVREAEREAKMQPIRKAFIAAKGGKT